MSVTRWNAVSLSFTSGLVVLIALLVGARLAGVVGIILSVPVVIIAQVFIDDFLLERRSDQVGEGQANA